MLSVPIYRLPLTASLATRFPLPARTLQATGWKLGAGGW
jgi:hypothetical protein